MTVQTSAAFPCTLHHAKALHSRHPGPTVFRSCMPAAFTNPGALCLQVPPLQAVLSCQAICITITWRACMLPQTWAACLAAALDQHSWGRFETPLEWPVRPQIGSLSKKPAPAILSPWLLYFPTTSRPNPATPSSLPDRTTFLCASAKISAAACQMPQSWCAASPRNPHLKAANP
jgi:hypothetical protein